MKKSILLLMLATGKLFAQNHPVTPHTVANQVVKRSVSGTVKDTTGQGIPGTTVKLLSGKDSMATSTDIDGAFVFKNVRGSLFTLTVTSIGYYPEIKTIKNTQNSKSMVLAQVILRSQHAVLDEVVINAKPALILKQDIVEYRSSDYKVRSTTGLDEMLKKMEGVDVGTDGSISHQGQAVTRVKINGKDYYGGDVRQAMRNLPADVIQKMQVIDDYGDQAAKTGIKSGDPQKILNINTNSDILETSNESYKQLIEKGFQKPLENPLSTFSVDVDAASYTNIRRFINSGQLPPKDAVRIEEMINYFSYNLPEPKNGKPVAILTELSSAPWKPQHRLLKISLKAKTVSAGKLPPGNLVFLVDVSGSMNEPNKLPLVKQSMKMLAEQLRPQDRVAIVVYAGNAGLVLGSTPGNEKEKIDNAIDNLSAGGSTAGCEGIKLAYKIARENYKKGGNNRIVLATDGDFNVGASSDESMEQLIAKERESGVDLSIMGFGMGNYKDSKMETMADKGNGNYGYIDNITEARKSLVSEFSGTLFTVAKDVKLQVEFNPAKVQSYRLIGYDDRMLDKEDFNNDKKDAGDMGAGHNVTAFYEIVPTGVNDNYAGSVDALKYQKAEKPVKSPFGDELATVKFRYKDPGNEVSKLSEVVVTDKPVAFDNTSADFRFAASVAEFGMLLRDSEFKQQATFNQAIAIAKTAKADDKEGYRSEFIRLAESAKLMTKGELAAK